MTAKLANICDVNPLIFSKAENDIYRANNPPILASSCQRDAFLGLFFDGTNNNKYRDLLNPRDPQLREKAAKYIGKHTWIYIGIGMAVYGVILA